MMKATAVALLVLCVIAPTHAYTFWSIGDWGGNDIASKGDANAHDNVMAVASALKSLAGSQGVPEFMINTGDSFYFCGLQNTSDPQIAADWVTPFVKDVGMPNLPWYGVLGNHEYGYNPQAVVDMSNVYSNWIIPSRYFSKRVSLSSSVSMTMIFLDTSPCVSDYRATDQSKWDPCGGEHPTCAGGPVEGPDCKLHENVLAQSCTTQESWLKSTLAAVDSSDWLVVVGHHEVDQVTEFDLTSMLQDSGVDLYLNGHVHALTHYTMDNKGAYVTTGAGSLCEPASSVAASPEGELRSIHDEDVTSRSLLHDSQTVYSKVVAGFTTHTFSSDFSSLTTTFLDNTLYNLHEFTITKNGGGGGGGGTCCHYTDSSCTSGQVCCTSGCSDPTTCGYTKDACNEQYAKAHNCEWTGTQCVVA